VRYEIDSRCGYDGGDRPSQHDDFRKADVFYFVVAEPGVEPSADTPAEDKPDDTMADEEPKMITAEDVQEAASFNDIE
jgi:hypothetical protein